MSENMQINAKKVKLAIDLSPPVQNNRLMTRYMYVQINVILPAQSHAKKL